jgi:exopolysaccharide biosynthesis WecB/TagA/CpsF family protein
MAVIDVPTPGLKSPPTASRRRKFMGAPFDCFTPDEVIELLQQTPSGTGFRYIVTPNVDHVVRLEDKSEIRHFYDGAWLSLCDSRPVSGLARLLFRKLPVVTGSDLTVSIFQSVIRDGDRITLIASSDAVVRDVQAAYPNVVFRAHLPPQGVWTNEAALMACVDFVAEAEARFVFIAIGSPQSEKIAHELSLRPEAKGIGLCIGASLEFLVGAKKRAPLWMRHAGIEWLHRLATDPKRLWRRYAYAVLPLARLFSHELLGRDAR